MPGDEALDLSVAIPAYGEPERLERCLGAVKRALEASPGLRAEIVVADDHSPGAVADRIAAAHPDVRLLRSEANRGFGANANRAVTAARAAVVCLLNSDMYVARDFFRDLHRAFDDDALFAICARIVEPGGTNAGLKHLLLSPRGARVHFARDTDPESDGPAHVPYANGGGAFFRRDLFLALGGFDPDFAPFYWEDTDLGYRAWKRGFRIVYDPSRRLEHDHQASIGREPRRRITRVRARNQRLFVWRNLTDRSLPALLLVGTLPVAWRLLLGARLRRLAWLLCDLRHLGRAARVRSAEASLAKRSDSEVRHLLESEARL